MLTPESVNHILKDKRKGRTRRPCYPCRQRKVKCDAARPCKRCIDRSHESLCAYEPPPTSQSARNRISNTATATETPESNLNPPSLSAPTPSVLGLQQGSVAPTFRDENTSSLASDILLGDHSVPSFLEQNYNATDPNADEISGSALPMLGLQPAPPSSLPQWETGAEEMQKLVGVLPPKFEMLGLFSQYRHAVHPLHPFLIDIDGFELKLCAKLEAMDSIAPVDGQSILMPSEMSWNAMLFAVMAAGLRTSNDRALETKSTCNRYIYAAYRCISLAQGWIRPSIDCIQALVLIAHVQQNELFTEAAWTILGLLSRQAQSLRIHVIKASPNQPASQELQYLKLWWTIMWQDSLLCMCFDRAPATVVRCTDPFDTLLLSDRPLNYPEGMYALSYLALRISARSHALIPKRTTYEEVMTDVNHMEKVRSRLQSRITARENCKTMQDHIEHLCFRLHSSYVTGSLLRPSLSPNKLDFLTPESRNDLVTKCLGAYKSALKAYVDLLALSTVARKSWAMLHNGLAAALILSIVGYAKFDSEVSELQRRLFQTLDDGNNDDHSGDRFWGPHRRGLMALKKMHDRQTMSPTNVHAPNMRQLEASAPGIITLTPDGPALTATDLPLPTPDYNNFDFFSCDPQTLDELSSFLPSNSDGTEIVVDDIFDSVLWGDYGLQGVGMTG